MATGAGLPDAERSVCIRSAARHLHRHAVEHRQLRLQRPVAREPIRTLKVIRRAGSLAVVARAFGKLSTSFFLSRRLRASPQGYSPRTSLHAPHDALPTTYHL